MAEDRKIVIESKEVLVEKWDEVLEQKGKYAEVYGTGAPKLRDDKQRAFVATMLESLEQTVLKENTVAGDIAVANPTLIPILRRITPAMIGPEMFGTQPMRTSNGVIYYLRSLYTGNDAANLKSAKSSLFVLSTTGGLVAGATVTQAGGLVGTVKYTETQGSTYYALVESTGTVATAGAQATIGTVSGTINSVVANEAAFQFILQGYSGPYSTSMNSYGASATNSSYETMTSQNEMGFTIEQDIMIARKRTLKTRWSRELEEDLRNDKNINAKELLVQLCSDEISREMNREFLSTMDSYCTTANGNSFTLAYASLDGRYEGEKYQNVCAAIDRIAFQTALRNRRGPANILICNAKALSILRSTGRLEGGAGAGINNTDAGTFEGKKVMFDLWADNTNPIIWLIYKGGEQDAGHFYGPYSPLRIDEGVGPEDNVPRLFFTTRYGLQANKFGAETYYAKLTMTGFPGYAWI
jgi:hypothetical protein